MSLNVISSVLGNALNAILPLSVRHVEYSGIVVMASKDGFDIFGKWECGLYI